MNENANDSGYLARQFCIPLRNVNISRDLQDFNKPPRPSLLKVMFSSGTVQK
jgi:hypothetical protein